MRSEDAAGCVELMGPTVVGARRGARPANLTGIMVVGGDFNDWVAT